MVHVQLLGGVTATTDAGAPLEVGPARCQAVLATLALSVGDSVTVSRLIEVLWGEDPPATADKTLQGYIARLRKNLGAQTIVRVGSAYRLDLEPDRVDVARFRRLLASGDVDGALVVWTGSPWSGVDIPGLTAASGGLVEQWLGAIEDQLQRRTVTDPIGAIAPLAELTAAHPFREELWALLMTALYRVGRQADALAAFQRVREHLIDELGVEPGPRLHQLERQILDHDPELVNQPDPATTRAAPQPTERGSATPTGTVTFALLGPLEIKRDGAAVHVGATKQRTLLLRLLIEPGSFVSVETLVEDLWPHEPPPGAAATIRTYVSHLRRALGGPPDSAVLRSSQGRGYTLDVSLEAVDAGRFQQLATEGRAQLRSGDAASAIELFDDAFALWRGEPLSDVSYENFAVAEITRLNQLYLSVCEDRFEALLAADRHQEAIPELDAFSTANPMRERPVGQLMIGLYRAGRAPDSLEVFHRFRERLSDEVGIDPSLTLQQLHQRVLQQSSDLDLGGPIRAVDPAPPGDVPPATGPAAPPLPRRLTSIVGRQTEMDRLAELLARSRLVSLVGPGGAGKTTLAIAGARISASDNPDGVWFVPLAAESDPARVALAVADTLGIPSDAATADRLVTARLAGRHALLVLDNCEHLADACARFVEALLQGTDGLKVLITSREALGVPGELQMLVPPLTPGEAAELFAERAAAVRPDLDLDPYAGDVARICDRLDGMPLAIELAAARVRTITPSEIASRLDDRFGLLTTGARTADARHRTLRGVVDWSHELLSADEQALFRRLAVFRDGWTLRAAEAVCDPDSSGDVLDVLGRLVERSLVVADGDRYSMLESILAYAQERLEASGEEPALRHAHLSYFAGLAASAEPALRGQDQARAHATLRRDEQNLRAALAWARDHVATEPAVGLGLAASLGWYWYVGRQVDGRAELSTMLAATRSAPPAVRARALQALSLSLRPGGCIVHANAEAADAARQSMVLFEGLGDRSRAALSQLLLAVEGVDGGDVPAHLRAVADARQVLHLEQDRWGMALADFVEMEIRLHQGDPDESLAIGRRAAAGFDALGDDWGRSAVRLHLGIGLRLAGDLEHAVPVLTEAAGISRASSLGNNLARSLEELGEAALWRGQLDEAAGWFDEAAAVAEELGDGLLQALVLVGRGDMERLRDDPIAARDHYLRAQAKLDGVGGSRGVVRVLVGQAAASLDVADSATAEQQLEGAGMAAEELNDAALRAAVLEQRARLAAVAGDREAVLGLLAEADALRIARRRPRTALEQRDVDALTGTDQAVSSVTM